MIHYDENNGTFGTFVIATEQYNSLRKIVPTLPSYNGNENEVSVTPKTFENFCELCDAIETIQN